MSTAMTQQEKESFLGGMHVGILSLPREGRAPLTVPIWYAYEPGAEICFVTSQHSQKGRLLRIGGQVSLCVQEERPPYTYVTVEGEISTIGPLDVERDVRSLARRYLGQERGDQYVVSIYGSEPAEGDVVVKLRPKHWLGADYGKGPAF